MADFVEMRKAVARATENDIVTRLHKMVYEGYDIAVSLEAADEIERLRTELREAQSEIQRLTYP